MLGLGKSLVHSNGSVAPLPLWTPSQISTAFWVDASDASTVILNGSTVSQWNDKSGNNRHATQATPAKQPLYDATGLGGKATIKCDGVDDNFTANSAAVAIGNNDFLFFLVTKFPMINFSIAVLRESSGPVMRGYLNRSSPANFSTSWGDPAANTPTLTGVAGIGNIVGAQRTGSSVQAFCNGTSSTTITATFNNSFSTLNFGSFTPLSQFADVWYSEIVIAVGTFSLNTIQNIQGYLAWKWGLVANLPSGHPYKNSPPIV